MRITKHTCDGPAFGRLTPGCPRCDELRAGAKPVLWVSGNLADLFRYRAERKRHDCKKAGCGPVCTFGDW